VDFAVDFLIGFQWENGRKWKKMEENGKSKMEENGLKIFKIPFF
jgi:hypothetical protein